MSKPLLLSAGQGKVQEFVGTSPGQVATWSETAEEWFAGPGVGGSGGGGEVFYFNFGNTGVSPTGTPLPQSTTSTPSTSPSLLGPTYNPTATSVESANLTNGSYSLVAGFLSASGSPGVLALPAGLWDFNIWAASTNASNATQCQIQARVYIANAAGTQYGNASGATNGTPLAVSDAVYLYEQATIAQYILNVTIPQTTITATDRIYIEFWAQKNVNQTRTVTFSFATNQPSHVHTTIFVPINLGTDVTGTLPVANGGTGATTLTGYVKGAGTAAMTASATIPAGDITGLSGTYAPLASPTFTGTPSLPTGTTGVTQTANDGSTKLATTLYADTAASNAKGAPYDVAGEYIGKPPVSTVLMRFVSNRSWTLKSSLVRASCTAFPTGSNAVATVSIAGSNLTNGTITWTTGSTVTIGSFTDTTITAGQVVVLTLTTADSGTTFENPFFTLGGVVA
jgi:hypothetical protein